MLNPSPSSAAIRRGGRSAPKGRLATVKTLARRSGGTLGSRPDGSALPPPQRILPAESRSVSATRSSTALHGGGGSRIAEHGGGSALAQQPPGLAGDDGRLTVAHRRLLNTAGKRCRFPRPASGYLASSDAPPTTPPEEPDVDRDGNAAEPGQETVCGNQRSSHGRRPTPGAPGDPCRGSASNSVTTSATDPRCCHNNGGLARPWSSSR